MSILASSSGGIPTQHIGCGLVVAATGPLLALILLVSDAAPATGGTCLSSGLVGRRRAIDAADAIVNNNGIRVLCRRSQNRRNIFAMTLPLGV